MPLIPFPMASPASESEVIEPVLRDGVIYEAASEPVGDPALVHGRKTSCWVASPISGRQVSAPSASRQLQPIAVTSSDTHKGFDGSPIEPNPGPMARTRTPSPRSRKKGSVLNAPNIERAARTADRRALVETLRTRAEELQILIASEACETTRSHLRAHLVMLQQGAAQLEAEIAAASRATPQDGYDDPTGRR